MKKKTKMKQGIEWLKDAEWLRREIKDINPYTLHASTLQEKVLELINQLDEPEVLSPEWIEEHEYIRMDPDNPFVYVKDLKNLLVPKQEEVDQAYKDGYEKGKEHATREEETETVASVIADYRIASAKLKSALSMEVEELEE